MRPAASPRTSRFRLAPAASCILHFPPASHVPSHVGDLAVLCAPAAAGHLDGRSRHPNLHSDPTRAVDVESNQPRAHPVPWAALIPARLQDRHHIIFAIPVDHLHLPLQPWSTSPVLPRRYLLIITPTAWLLPRSTTASNTRLISPTYAATSTPPSLPATGTTPIL